MPSPFPGMDPYLEDPERWPDVHLRLIAALGDVLMEKLRPRYVVRADERVYVADEDDGPGEVAGRPDLTVVARPSSPTIEPPRAGGAATPVLVPTVLSAEHRERSLVVRLRDTLEVVAVIEILSPTNKRGPASPGRQAYLAKRRQVLASTAHLVEVDLLRAGQRVPMARPLPAAEYYVIVSRAAARPECEVYPVALRDRVPAFSLPLAGDEAVVVDLQAILDGVYERAGYELDVDYSRSPPPPAFGPDDADWVARTLAERRPRA